MVVPVLGGLRTVTGDLDLDGGGFELADASAHELESLRRRGKLLAPQLGIPAKLLDIDLSDRDVQRIARAVLDDGKAV